MTFDKFLYQYVFVGMLRPPKLCVTLTDSHSVASISGLKPVTVTGDVGNMAGLSRIRRQRVAKGDGLDDGA